jgi:glycosyltransferase involved in cell wall biosynthesis
LFSIIVATYARPDLLREAIDSVLLQTVSDFECIVVDDGGPVPASVPEDPRIRLIRRDINGGPAAAWNTALNVARGRYVTFLGDDDMYLPDRLKLALEGLREAPVAVCWGRATDDTAGFKGPLLMGDVRDSVLDSMAPSLGVTAVRRDIAPWFDERFLASADVEWWLRLAHVASVSTVPELGYLVRRHAGPRHLNGVEERIRCSQLLLEVHGDYFATHPRARAFRWKRIGLMARRIGDKRLSRAAFSRALRIRFEARTLIHLLKSLTPGSKSGALRNGY